MLNQKIIKFLFLAVILYGGWLLLYEILLKPSGKLDHILTENITYILCFLLELSGYQPHYTGAQHIGETYIFLASNVKPIIRVGASCNGLELLVLFTIFIICFPGKWKTKLWFIPTGLLLIHVLNVARNYMLTLMAIHKSPYFDLFHRYIFVFMVYGAIFLLWVWFSSYLNTDTSGNGKK